MVENTAVTVIEKIASGGAGMGRINGKIVFVPYTLPGEKVRVRLVREKKDCSWACLLEVLESSPQRVTPECRLFALCGGCDFQHTSYDVQKKLKQDLARETFKRIGHIDIDDMGEIPFEESPPFGYRSRVRLHRCAGTRNPPSARPQAAAAASGWAFREAADNGLVPLQHCPVATPEINAFLTLPAAGGEGRGDCLQVFGWKGITAFRPEDVIDLTLCGKNIVFSPECFFQSNIPLVEKLMRAAFADISGGYALELYGGVGTFGIFLEDRFRSLVSVEENPVSASFARRNLNSARARVFSGSAEKWIASSGYRAKCPDAVIVDPPRAGLSVKVRAFLKKLCAPLVVYVSCDAGSLARDSAFLLDCGYALRDYRVFDFYPQTAHVESLCRFTRN
jgi:23S rRNA (uracil1939-C5)-methyltransferase